MKLETLAKKAKNSFLLTGSLLFLNSCSPLVIKDFDRIYKKDFPMAELEISKFGSQIDYQKARNISAGKNNAIAFEYWIDEENSDILLINGNKIYRVTDFPGYEGEPQINADETKIVFTGDKNGKTDIFLADLKEKKLLQLTDGNKSYYSPSITADGKKISFTGENKEENEGNADIYLLELEKRVLTNISNGEFGEYQPWISSDGNRIAFVSEQKGSSVFIRELKTDSLILIKQSYDDKKYSNPKLNYNGTKIVYEEIDEKNGNSTILFKDLDSLKQMSWPVNKGYDGEPSIDSAGNYISWITRQKGKHEKKKMPFEDRKKKFRIIKKDEEGNLWHGRNGRIKLEYKRAKPKIKIVDIKTNYIEFIENQVPQKQMGAYISAISLDGKSIISLNKESRKDNYQIKNPLYNRTHESELEDALKLEKELRGK